MWESSKLYIRRRSIKSDVHNFFDVPYCTVHRPRVRYLNTPKQAYINIFLDINIAQSLNTQIRPFIYESLYTSRQVVYRCYAQFI